VATTPRVVSAARIGIIITNIAAPAAPPTTAVVPIIHG
jgi:hypothetical protein